MGGREGGLSDTICRQDGGGEWGICISLIQDSADETAGSLGRSDIDSLPTEDEPGPSSV